MTAQRGTREFRDDDGGYLDWLSAHPDGYVINVLRSHRANGARVHCACCRTINGQNPRAGTWTGPYVKRCAENLAQLDQWAIKQLGEPIVRCGICRPGGAAAQPMPTTQTVRSPAAAGRSKVHGPPDGEAVEAWADDYVRFERRPPWQQQLRNEIRSRCRQLEPLPGQVLHATFFGPKLPRADVENLVLYNFGSLSVADRNGVRFEYGNTVPPAPNHAHYRFSYRYALAPRSGAFDHWQQGRRLASFDWADLGAFAGDKKLAQVWLAISQGAAEVDEPVAPETPFAVRVHVRPPHGYQPGWSGLVKGIFDGVICAFQVHTDAPVAPAAVVRLAKNLRVEPDEIERLLLNPRRAVLGSVRRLVSPYRGGVKWNPSDHLCVAGELLAAEPQADEDRWAIKGEIVELFR